jgi:hypothetical protein
VNAGNQAALRDDWLTVGTRRLSRGLAGLALVAAALFVSAPPAGAHSLGGAVPTNYRTRITSIVPELPGVEMRVVEAGSRLELTNRSSEDVVVTGYAEEAYLRIGPKGVFENRRSPATYLNRSRLPTSDIPARADPEAPPDWRRVSSARTVRWHDHRAHWMGGQDPPEVAADRGVPHVVDDEWVIPLVVGGERVEVVGDLVWIPGPDPAPWVLAAIGLLGAVLLLGRGRGWPATAVAGTVVLGATLVVDATGAWQRTAEPAGSKLGPLVAPAACLALAGTGLAGATSRRSPTALWRLLLGSLGTAVIIGLVDVDWLRRSQLPTTLHPDLARTAVVVAIGVGLGLVVLSGHQLGARYVRLAGTRPVRGRRRDSVSRPPASGGQSDSRR